MQLNGLGVFVGEKIDVSVANEVSTVVRLPDLMRQEISFREARTKKTEQTLNQCSTIMSY